ncbi:MAG: glutamate-5-semialdehyde dehydrogenase [Acutalibacteraceae bacterium]
MTEIELMGERAKAAAQVLATARNMKNTALYAIADALESNIREILDENLIDLATAKQSGMTDAFLDRLTLTSNSISAMADGVRKVAMLADPIENVISGDTLPNGLEIKRVRVPLGVIGIIYESRPNVTADAAALCLKAGNALILRGGKEAIRSNKCIADIMRRAIKSVGLPEDSVQIVTDTSRESAMELMRLRALDVLIPRGGAGLIRSVVENARVPIIQTGVGNCHVYVDKVCDMQMAVDIIYNAKTSKPSVCNAIETILVHKDIAEKILPMIKAKLDEKHVELRGCKRTREILGDCVVPATEEDWWTEYLDYILAVKVVSSLDEAMAHITKYSSGHSEAIVTDCYENAKKFTLKIDAAAVYVNASTRFTDGGEFGLGAEIGISTQKLHARGPMGINDLTSTKFIIYGTGQVR